MHRKLREVFSGKRVLITGNTGFKGSWLTLWLKELAADLIGYSLPPSTTPSFFDCAELGDRIVQVFGDIRDLPLLQKTVEQHQPHIIFHLAAQSLVLEGYRSPLETLSINALGTAHLLEALREVPSVQAIVVVTTDKCYENREWCWGYRENDPLGGQDPYSASKAMAELVTACYRDSFFKKGPPIATVRAGNVIGGGDFSPFRLIPDAMKAFMNEAPVLVRNPQSRRAWMHVLDALYGYLRVASELLENPEKTEGAWNFGPGERLGASVLEMISQAAALWGSGSWEEEVSKEGIPKETRNLQLNWDKAATLLNWHPRYSYQEALAHTVSWYKAYHKALSPAEIQSFSISQIHQFMNPSQIFSDEIYSYSP